jgi:hypothetical protein
MKRNSLGNMAAALACVAMIMPSSALAIEPAANKSDATAQASEVTAQHSDVALRPGGILVGQVVDQQGAVKPGTVVSVQYSDYEVARTTTDDNGVFAAQGLRGGQYQLVTDDGISVCRLWAPDTAPPAARPAALVVSGNRVVRGQWGGGPMHQWIDWVKAHPYITAGVIATAIAIPLAIADDDDEPSGS